MDKKCFVWMFGTILQYKVIEGNEPLTITLNVNLLNKIKSMYPNLCYVMKVRDLEEAKQLRDAFVKLGNIDIKKVYIYPYQYTTSEIAASLFKSFGSDLTFIDYSKSRLVELHKWIKASNLIHISQLLD